MTLQPREHPVPCRRCTRMTWRTDAYCCEPCSSSGREVADDTVTGPASRTAGVVGVPAAGDTDPPIGVVPP